MIYLIIIILIIQLAQIVLFIQFVNLYIRDKEKNDEILPIPFDSPAPPVSKQRWEDGFLKEQEMQRKVAEIQKQDSIII
jgi:uncharacterized membrane protein